MLFFCFACKTKNSVRDSSTETTVSTPVFENKSYSGVYGDISLAVYNKKITGVYEYYDNWSKKDNEFLDINIFYFDGILTNDSVALITASWPPTGQKMTGIIEFPNDSKTNSPYLKIRLNDQPLGYNDVDFTQGNGVKMILTEHKDWIAVRLITQDKCITFNSPNDDSVRKSYLIKNDIVKVLKEGPGEFEKVEYKSPKGTINIYWIKRSAFN
jgi:hypothetical protein